MLTSKRFHRGEMRKSWIAAILRLTTASPQQLRLHHRKRSSRSSSVSTWNFDLGEMCLIGFGGVASTFIFSAPIQTSYNPTCVVVV